MYISELSPDNFYFHSSNICDARTWPTYDKAAKFVDESSVGGQVGSAYTKHVVIELSDKEWFECKLKGEFEDKEEYDPAIEDCGCELCSEYIAENGTLSEQLAEYEQWKKVNPSAVKKWQGWFKKKIDAVMKLK